MNIITLQTPKPDQEQVQLMINRFMDWSRKSNTDFSSLCNAELYQHLHRQNSNGGISRRDLLEVAFQRLVQLRNTHEPGEEPLTQPGQIPLPSEMDDDLFSMIFPIIGPAADKDRNVPPLMDE